MPTSRIVPWSQIAPERRYHAERIPGGFRFSGIDRCTVEVHLISTFLMARCGAASSRFGLVEYRGLVRWIAEHVIGGVSFSDEHVRYTPRWFVQMTERVVNAHVHPLWRALISEADPRALALQRRILGSTFCHVPAVVLSPEIFRHPHIVSDICRYPAAAIAAVVVDWMAQRLDWIPDRYPYGLQLQQAREDWIKDCSMEKPPELHAENPRTVQFHLELLSNWRTLFAPNGVPYASLNKTLMNLPGGITPRVLGGLRLVSLERPVTDRLELLTVGTGAQCRRRHHDHVLAHANRSEIVEAMHLVGDSRNRMVARELPRCAPTELSPRRTKDVAFFTQYLSDYPEVYRGRIVGLARRATQWHENEAQQQRTNLARAVPDAQATAMPRTPLPEIEGIQFLSTVGEIRDEAKRMRHCISTYADDAVRGLCFLFHIEHEGEMATVEVDRQGRVIQAQGPGNCNNRAASWGRRELAAWAHPLKDKSAA